jgi:hypothetical protein
VKIAGKCSSQRHLLASHTKAYVHSCVRLPTTRLTTSLLSAVTAVWSYISPAISVSWVWQRCCFFHEAPWLSKFQGLWRETVHMLVSEIVLARAAKAWGFGMDTG